MNKGRVKRLAVGFVAVLCAAIFCACLPFEQSGRHFGYGDIIKGFFGSDDGVIAAPPDIDGFTALYDAVFDMALPFDGEYSFAVRGGVFYLVRGDGGAERAVFHYPHSTVRDGRYVFSPDGTALGLISVDGAVLIEPQFDFIEFCGGTAVAARDGFYFVYRDGNLTAGFLCGKITLIADNMLLLEGVVTEDGDGGLTLIKDGIYDCGLNEVFADGYRVCGALDSAFIVEGRGGYGIADGKLNVLVPPLYESVLYCGAEFAVVSRDGDYIVTDFLGGETLKTDKHIVYYDGTYAVFKENGVYFVADNRLNLLTDKTFVFVSSLMNMSDGFLLLTDESDAPVYSAVRDEFLLYGYKNVSINGEIITALNASSGKYSVFDGEFNEILSELNYAAYSNGVLTVGLNEKFMYYVPD